MAEILEPLILDLVEWVGVRPRDYSDVMDAWRTSCPRLTVWEDAVDGGYVVHQSREGPGRTVSITPRGRQLLRDHGRDHAASQRSAA